MQLLDIYKERIGVMIKANFSDDLTKLATIPQAKNRYKLSRNTLMKIAGDANAIRRFGRSVRIDIEVLDGAIEQY